jgi:hypothetical protein
MCANRAEGNSDEKRLAKVVARPTTVPRSALIIRSGYAPSSHTKSSPKANPNGVLEEMPLIGRIKALRSHSPDGSGYFASCLSLPEDTVDAKSIPGSLDSRPKHSRAQWANSPI